MKRNDKKKNMLIVMKTAKVKKLNKIVDIKARRRGMTRESKQTTRSEEDEEENDDKLLDTPSRVIKRKGRTLLTHGQSTRPKRGSI